MKQHLFVAATAALSLPCLAQDYIGFSYNCQVGATSRGALGVNAGEVMARIAGDEFAGWGTNTPGTRTIGTLFYVIQDQNAATAETFNIKLYPEDAANPGYPDLTAGVVYATGVTGPTGTGVVATVKTTPPDVVGVGDSVPIVGGGDVFISWELPANALWATDGLSINVVLGYAPNTTFLVYDTPSLAQGSTPPPVGAPGNSHGLSRTGSGAATYNARRMPLFDVLHNTSGGIGLAITNQTTFTASNNPPPAGFGPAPGTASMMSGTNLDINGGNPGRLDDLSMEYFRTGLGATGLVLFLIDTTGTFGPEIPIAVTGLAGTGSICVTGNFGVLGVVPTVADEAFFVTPIPAGSRATLIGQPVVQQAVGIDSAFSFHLSPCRRSIL